ncbi:hypothetical protein OD91_2095 [Lutibacter sp. Hel_I_33_5]|uniref:DUF6090 family protein n=1 Tax=Lutibacter sp. Hel_I_33_5 TaxID=1566289 RepID=UPI00119F7C44|nr:DUF6090 family protein [Lutibacter sp. Hel_I_33_5]TVZ56796.1 hypothetical protein OD91_2095 [Lutibacter sp. Hel_I_33_5]
MIKFFRHIRKSLLEQNKTSKYFKYAIGEIVLVVIGILIALQINNWNEYRKNQSNLESYILAYKYELEYNIKHFDFEIAKAENFIKQNIKTLQTNNFDSIQVDTLENMIETFYVNFDTENFVHERFKNSQITDFGKYDSIVNKMQVYYAWNYAELKDVLIQHNSAVDKADDYWRFQQNSYEFNYQNNKNTSKQTSELRKQRIIKLLNNPRARNILKLDIRKKKETIQYFKAFQQRSKENLEQINRTLRE